MPCNCSPAVESSPFFGGSVKVVACCRLQFCDASGTVLCEINLTNVNIYSTSSGGIGLDDGVSKKTFSENDALALGYVDVVAFRQYIEQQRILCCEEDSKIDTEIVCVEENNNLYIACIDTTTSPVSTSIKDFAGNDVTGTVTPTVCQDLTFQTEVCDFCVDGMNYRRVDCIKKGRDGTVLGVDSFWQDITGTVVTDPTATATKITKGFCEICTPATTNFLGNNAPSGFEFHEFSFRIPACCGVKVTTSAGEYIFDKVEEVRYICEEYQCLITDFQIEALTPTDQACVDAIRTQLTKKK